MIDEPDFFSLWATLDVHAESDGSVPISTNFHRTTSMWEAKEGESGARMGTKDDFVTVFSNGSLYSTTVVVRNSHHRSAADTTTEPRLSTADLPLAVQPSAPLATVQQGSTPEPAAHSTGGRG